MDKLLTILCSDTMGDIVTRVLEKNIEKEGYVRFSSGYGVKCKVPVAGAYQSKCIPWEAEMFISPLSDDTLQKVVKELKEYTLHCETSPCLRIIVSPVLEIY